MFSLVEPVLFTEEHAVMHVSQFKQQRLVTMAHDNNNTNNIQVALVACLFIHVHVSDGSDGKCKYDVSGRTKQNQNLFQTFGQLVKFNGTYKPFSHRFPFTKVN